MQLLSARLCELPSIASRLSLLQNSNQSLSPSRAPFYNHSVVQRTASRARLVALVEAETRRRRSTSFQDSLRNVRGGSSLSRDVNAKQSKTRRGGGRGRR